MSNLNKLLANKPFTFNGEKTIITKENGDASFDEAEKHIAQALYELTQASHEVGKHIPLPYHLEKAKLEVRHALKRFKIRRTRMED